MSEFFLTSKQFFEGLTDYNNDNIKQKCITNYLVNNTNSF